MTPPGVKKPRKDSPFAPFLLVRIMVSVRADNSESGENAKALAMELGLPLSENNTGMVLEVGAKGLSLLDYSERAKPLRLTADFSWSAKAGYLKTATVKNLPLAKALKVQKGTRIFDATGGLGEDALLLAWVGAQVTSMERSPILFALVRDGLRRALESHDELSEVLRERIDWRLGDSAKYLRDMSSAEAPDAIYMDPMFPEKKKSALPKKEMQVFRKLVGSDPDAQVLLEAALLRTRGRVVVKRPLLAPDLLPGVSHTIESKLVRLDVYTVKR